jgi:hypothetical protein
VEISRLCAFSMLQICDTDTQGNVSLIVCVWRSVVEDLELSEDLNVSDNQLGL